MKRSDIKILIVEDDSSLSLALKEGLKRQGYQVKAVANAERAMAAQKVEEFHGALIDCMIPKTNGIDLAELLRKELGPDFKIFLMSGIYRDQHFVSKAIHRTQALKFFSKPFDMEDLFETIADAFSAEVVEEAPDLYQFLMQKEWSTEDAILAIDNEPDILSFDLLMIFSLLSRSKATGALSIQTEDNLSGTISFHKGNVSDVQISDKESFFGVLLVEKGFISPEELEHGLNLEVNKRIGERLVDINSLSPHFIEIVQKEQMIIRLSKTIQPGTTQISFRKQDVEPSDAMVDALVMGNMLSDWVFSKVQSEWLQKLFINWCGNGIIAGKQYASFDQLLHLPVFLDTPDFKQKFTIGNSLQELLDKVDDSEENVFRTLFYLLMTQVLCLDTATADSQMDFGRHLVRLQKISTTMEKQNYFDILGVDQFARSQEVNRSYHELAKALHPDRLPPNAPDDVRQLTESVYAKIAEAYSTLKDSASKKKYCKQLEYGGADEILEAEARADEAKELTKKGNHTAALKLFEEIKSAKRTPTGFHIYYLWSLLKMGAGKRHYEDFLEEVHLTMKQIPPEDRHNSTYFLVRGLYHKTKGNLHKAAKYFQHARDVDPKFIEAKRELASLQSLYNNKTSSNTIIGELTAIFGTGKKKRRKF